MVNAVLLPFMIENVVEAVVVATLVTVHCANTMASVLEMLWFTKHGSPTAIVFDGIPKVTPTTVLVVEVGEPTGPSRIALKIDEVPVTHKFTSLFTVLLPSWTPEEALVVAAFW